MKRFLCFAVTVVTVVMLVCFTSCEDIATTQAVSPTDVTTTVATESISTTTTTAATTTTKATLKATKKKTSTTTKKATTKKKSKKSTATAAKKSTTKTQKSTTATTTTEKTTTVTTTTAPTPAINPVGVWQDKDVETEVRVHSSNAIDNFKFDINFYRIAGFEGQQATKIGENVYSFKVVEEGWRFSGTLTFDGESMILNIAKSESDYIHVGRTHFVRAEKSAFYGAD